MSTSRDTRQNVKALVLGALALVLGTTAPASAQTSEKPLAETLFQQGRALLEAGRAEEACLRFAESQRIEASVGTLLNLAMCHEQTGRTASAWAEFVELAVQAGRLGQTKRESFARERAAALDAVLARLVVVADDPIPDLVVLLDGLPLVAATLGSPLPLDPGPHEIEARAPGRRAWHTRFELGTGPRVERLIVPPLELEPAAETAAPPPSTRPGSEPSPTSTAPPSRNPPFTSELSISPLFWSGLGLAVVGSGVGAVTGALSLLKADEVRASCEGNVCPTRVRAEADEALALATVSNVSFAVAASGLVMGLVGLALSDFGGQATSEGPEVSLGVTTAGTLGIVGSFD